MTKHSAMALLRDVIGKFRGAYLRFSRDQIQPAVVTNRFFSEVIPRTLLIKSQIPWSQADTNAYISSRVLDGHPTMIARFGESELRAILGIQRITHWPLSKKVAWRALSLESIRWDSSKFSFLGRHAGFFPTSDRLSIERFATLNLQAAGDLDLLGSWLPGENLLENLPEKLEVTSLENLVPFGADSPWTAALAGKRVLVVHPFAYSINMQYSKRRKLFPDPDFIPQFELCVVQAPQTVNDGRGLGSTGFSSWFEALESLKFRVGQADFDVAIVGAGAYGFPLASFVKSLGKVAIHLGGATQLLFGIWGNRWNSDVDMQSLRNRNWVRPSASETPVNSEDIEGAAYW